MSERISIAKLREQFTLWPQVLHVLDTVEAAHEVVEDGTSRPALSRLAEQVERFDFEDA